ncbi:MAG: hypothetical protein GWP10_01755 [Nitrospiraceae bacterium]|nr:hypothetical protein [Nitrospiraceae bacterium]
MKSIKRVSLITILVFSLICFVGISISIANDNISNGMIQKIQEIKSSQNNGGHFAGINESTVEGYIATTYGLSSVATYPLGGYITRTQIKSLCQEEGWPLVYSSPDFDLIVCPNVLEEYGDGLILVWYDSQNRAPEMVMINKKLP